MTSIPVSLVTEEMSHAGSRYLVIGYSVPRPPILLELTPAELAVMDAWLVGSSMRAIAIAKNSSVRTVSNQIANIYRKLGVGSRSELQARLQANTGERL